MQLQRFRVTNFRSVDDSGWIETSDVTALIGTNESGKTNLLVPLWKLNPAGKEGAIDLLADAPRKIYNDLRSGDKSEPFIEAEFETDAELTSQLTGLTGCSPEDVKTVRVIRRFDGLFQVSFPNDNPPRAIESQQVLAPLVAAQKDLANISALKSEEGFKSQVVAALDESVQLIGGSSAVAAETLREIVKKLTIETDGAPKTSTVVPRSAQLREALQGLLPSVSRARIDSSKDARQAVVKALPKFVYYANYGNLDSEIYLPHVIENMERDGLGVREAAKARTLKVLFEFVKLEPQEILELGQEFQAPGGREPTDAEISAIAKKKKERDVLLQSASTDLTQKFRAWWKQGEYRFRFQADGDHFRIWVSDDRRPEDIELEGRSTGLQWFLSFYLIFLVESQDAHAGAILLLDEPGHSLHPLAQRDLSEFFESLSNDNQLLYTTHSPFLVDPNHLDRVKAVYVQDDGTTAVSSDLRAGEKDPAQTKSIYPVHAALGLSVSDTLLVGSEPIIVEGISDQFYLSAAKVLLISAGKLTPAREVVFVPAGGVRGIKAVAGILAGKDSALPRVLLDADSVGRQMAKELRNGLYAASVGRVVDLSSVLTLADAEIEDVMPREVMVQVLSRTLHGPDEDFAEVHDASRAVLPQVEAFAAKHGMPLEPGWKVEIAKQVKTRLLRGGVKALDPNLIEKWGALFNMLTAPAE